MNADDIRINPGLASDVAIPLCELFDRIETVELRLKGLPRSFHPPLDRVKLAAKLANELGGIIDYKPRSPLDRAERIIAFLDQQGALRP